MDPFVDTAELPTREVRPGWHGRFVHSAATTFAYYDFSAGFDVHEHHHANEETWHIISGTLDVTVGNRTQRCGPGTVAMVAPNQSHRVIAVTDGTAIVVDSPRRDTIGGMPT